MRWIYFLASLTIALLGAEVGKAQAQRGADKPISFKPVKHVIDTHLHVYDTRREKGVPWPPRNDKVLYKPHLPEEYKRLAKAAGVTGAVIVEASDQLEDNRWVLDRVK